MLPGPNPSGRQRVNKMSQFHIVFTVAYWKSSSKKGSLEPAILFIHTILLWCSLTLWRLAAFGDFQKKNA